MTTATPVKFNITSENGVASSVTAFVRGRTFVATQEHPRFANIVAELTNENIDLTDEDVESLFDIGVGIDRAFKALSDRVSIKSGVLYFDLKPMNSALAKTIVNFYLEGHSEVGTLVNFLEKIEQNPSTHSRENLFRWLDSHRFAIHPDGDFIAYKGVYTSERKGFKYESSSSGTAIVNGEVWTGRIPTSPGLVVEMPRDQVEFNPHVGCSTGLHAGNWRYASGFAKITLRVKINPRDVVSVPTDSADEKLRVCRYRILEEVKVEDTSMLFVGDEERTLALTQGKRNAQVKISKAMAEKYGPVSYDEPAKPKVKRAAKTANRKSAAKPTKATIKKASAPSKRPPKPKFYEEFTVKDFRDRDLIGFGQLQWLAKEWGIATPKPRSTENYAQALARAAAARRRKLADKKLAPKERTKLS